MLLEDALYHSLDEFTKLLIGLLGADGVDEAGKLIGDILTYFEKDTDLEKGEFIESKLDEWDNTEPFYELVGRVIGKTDGETQTKYV